MQLGMIGLGTMGDKMRTRLRRDGHAVIGYDLNPLVSDVASMAELVNSLTAPRAVWVMVKAGPTTTAVIDELAQLLEPGDIVIDGGNSPWTDDQRNADLLGDEEIGYIGAGISGGKWGLDIGYGVMVGGSDEDVERLMPIFMSLKPPGKYGFVHCGGVEAGHFAKMAHNAIEYAIMQAWGEGFELLLKSGRIKDIPALFNSWREGTVVRSWLLDLLCNALDGDPTLDKILGVANSSGEAQWALEAALGLKVPMPCVAAALFARNVSCQEGNSPAMRVVAVLRNQFGDHATVAA